MTGQAEASTPDPDSQYRLIPCKCGCSDVRYRRRISTPPRRVEWAVVCMACGNTSRYWPIKHHAQIEWNGKELPSWERNA